MDLSAELVVQMMVDQATGAKARSAVIIQAYERRMKELEAQVADLTERAELAEAQVAAIEHLDVEGEQP